MAALLEEQDLKRYPGVGGGNIDERERMVREGEKRLKEEKEQLKIDLHHLKSKQDSLSQLSLFLKDQQEDLDH